MKIVSPYFAIEKSVGDLRIRVEAPSEKECVALYKKVTIKTQRPLEKAG